MPNSSDWREDKLNQIRNLIKEADPEVIEEQKWKKATNPEGIPVWSHGGMICTGETYKDHLRLTFSKGSYLKDPKHLINSYRAMTIGKEDEIDNEAFKNLIREAVDLNLKKK